MQNVFAIRDPAVPDAKKIARCKNIIASNPSTEEARTALIWYYSIIRSNYVEDNLGEKNGFYDYLKQLRTLCKDSETGKTALRYMIIWKMLENNKTLIYKHLKEVLKVRTGEDKKWILVDLAYMNDGNIKEANKLIMELERSYKNDQDLITDIKNFIAETKERLGKEELNQEEIIYSSESEINIPKEFALLQNYPNPFNPTTAISYQLTANSNITLKIYDVLGREVATLADGIKEAGYYTATFDASGLSSGIYFARLTATPQDGQKPFVQVRKLMMTK